MPEVIPDQKPIEPTGYEKSRAEVLTEGVKGLFIINGGGAVALLGFMQAIWSKEPALARLTLIGLGLMSAGVVFAALIQFLRLWHSHEVDPNQKSLINRGTKTITWHLRNICIFGSLACFACACLVLVVGGLGLAK